MLTSVAIKLKRKEQRNAEMGKLSAHWDQPCDEAENRGVETDIGNL